ncbi:hypothetical protein SAMN04487936_10954 [Halobacillus dabanensis]|uniref:Uncharacterized protein n=2 Tax=Halobacillus dabanensis TaxID=240302 RepID=A0A1I3XND5_HALDA|nr:hypothetical protein SAMN04487936_10954 [Halobacillus dabanensis]
MKITKKSGEILQSHGALDHNIYYSNELTGRQGSLGFLNFIEMEEDEELLLGQSLFKNEDHYYEIMKNVGSDDIIQYLDGHIKDIVEMNRVVTSSFTSVKASQANA